MDDEIKIRVSDIIFALKKHWKLIVATTVAGLIFGLVLTAMSYMQSTLVTYKINGSFAISSLNEKGFYVGTAGAATNVDYSLVEKMADAVMYVINSRPVVNAAIENEKLIGVDLSDLQRSLSLSRYGETQIIEMTLVWRSADEGIEIWNAIITAANRYIPKALMLGTLVPINEPRASQMGISRAGPKLAVMLSGLGVMAGVGFAVVSMLLHPTLNNLKDVDAVLGLETIGMIPQSLTWTEQNGNILTRTGGSEVVESYSAATYILRNRLGSKEKHRCFYITSTTAKEGKSVVAANIAIQLSGMECHTLLIDFDTRNPDIGAMFLPELDYAVSLNALYRGEANEYDVITHINGYLDLMMMIPEHNPIPLDGTIEDLFSSLIEKYEYVVINASPVGMVSETLSLNQVTNNVLFVVGYDSASMADIQASLQKMDKSGTRVIGCIVTGVKSKTQSGSGILPPFIKGMGQGGNLRQKNISLMDSDVPANLEDDLINLVEKPKEKTEEKTEDKPVEKPKAKERQKLFGRKKAVKKKDEAPAPDVKPPSPDPSAPSAPAAPAASRYIMDELIAEEPKEEKKTDDDTIAELIRMSVTKDQDGADDYDK